MYCYTLHPKKRKDVNKMSLISKIVVISVIGGFMLLVNIFIIKDNKSRLVLDIAATLTTLLWFLQSLGILVGHINVMH